MDKAQFETIRQSPRQATIVDVENLCDEIVRLTEEVATWKDGYDNFVQEIVLLTAQRDDYKRRWERQQRELAFYDKETSELRKELLAAGIKLGGFPSEP